jgi:hypothetical protein
MALCAGVRRAERDRQVGPRHAEAVIAPHVDDRIGLGRHVAVDALRGGAARLVVMVLGRVEFRGHVALGAQRIAAGAQLRAARVVAIGAGDPGVRHAALQERAVFVDLAVDLPVGVIEARLKQRRTVGVEERCRPVSDSWRSLCGGNEGGTGLDLDRGQLLGAPGDAGLRVHLPIAMIGRLQPIGQAHLVGAVGRLGLLG